MLKLPLSPLVEMLVIVMEKGCLKIVFVAQLTMSFPVVPIAQYSAARLTHLGKVCFLIYRDEI